MLDFQNKNTTLLQCETIILSGLFFLENFSNIVKKCTKAVPL